MMALDFGNLKTEPAKGLKAVGEEKYRLWNFRYLL